MSSESWLRWKRTNPEDYARSVRIGGQRRRENKADEIRDYNRWHLSKRKKRNDRFVAAYKLFFGCIDCGYRSHDKALVPDHVAGKAFDIGFLSANGRSLISIYTELQKCEIRCANCHAIRHYGTPEKL